MDQSGKDEDSKVTPAAWPAVTPQQPEPAPDHRRTLPARLDAGLPVVVAKRRARTRWVEATLLFVVLIGGSGGGYYWWQQLHPALPPGIVFGNGRLEADEIDIDTKYAARIAEIMADEGDLVKAGQVVARMDTRDLQASLKKSQAQRQPSAKRPSTKPTPMLLSRRRRCFWPSRRWIAPLTLVQKGFETKELLDQRQQQLDGANAALNAAQSRVTEAEHALDAATHDVELYTVEIADDTLVAPRDGRIQYRIANIGEVLPAGGKVFAMLDVSYVYMDIYLPTERGGQSQIRRPMRASCSMPIRTTRSRPRCRSSPRRRSSRRKRWRPRANATS